MTLFMLIAMAALRLSNLLTAKRSIIMKKVAKEWLLRMLIILVARRFIRSMVIKIA